MTSTKPYEISKRKVLEAYRKVRANGGGAGIDGESIEMLAADLQGNLYKRSRPEYSRIQFTFLGYTFRPRSSGKARTGFLPAVSRATIKEMYSEMRQWQLPRQSSVSLAELAQRYDPILRGWLSYYGVFYRSALRVVFDHFDRLLARWARRKYRRLACHPRRSHEWVRRVAQRSPRLFCHWRSSGQLRYARWEPYDGRLSRTVLRGALGATPEVYSPSSAWCGIEPDRPFTLEACDPCCNCAPTVSVVIAICRRTRPMH